MNSDVGPLESVASLALSHPARSGGFSRPLGSSHSASSSLLPSPRVCAALSFLSCLRYAVGVMSRLRFLHFASAFASRFAAARWPSGLLLLAPAALPGTSSASSSAASGNRLRFPLPLSSHAAALRHAYFAAFAHTTGRWLSSLPPLGTFCSAASVASSSAVRPNPSVERDRLPAQPAGSLRGFAAPAAPHLRRWAS